MNRADAGDGRTLDAVLGTATPRLEPDDDFDLSRPVNDQLRVTCRPER